MKKFSSEYFEKKYRILFNKLKIKDGFENSVVELRKKLGLPDIGFQNELELAEYFLSKLNKDELNLFLYIIFAEDFAKTNNLDFNEANSSGKIYDAFIKQYKGKGKDQIKLLSLAQLSFDILNHNQMITKNIMFRENKYLNSLFGHTHKLIEAYWGFECLDEHIFGHLVEKYLFLGEYGINKYIKQKVSCPNCKYIGITHFSPTRHNMINGEKGISNNYIFDQETVKLLSLHYNSVFIIVKPYASKKEAIQYIEDNWESIKEHIIEKNPFYKQFGVNPSKIKESNFERNQLVYDLYKLPKKELIQLCIDNSDLSGPYHYKEEAVQRILLEKYQIKMSEDAIRKTAVRFRKESLPKRIPKDSEDI